MTQNESKRKTIKKIRETSSGEEISQAILDHAREYWVKEKKPYTSKVSNTDFTLKMQPGPF